LLISVVVPCFNSRGFVTEAVESVFCQTYPSLELICIDDGSTDGTADLLEELRLRSPIPMQVIRTVNGGASAARNVGLERARGEYIQFLDSDDLLRPGKIAHQVELIQAQPDPPALVAADYIERALDGSEAVRSVDRRGVFFALLDSRCGITTANLWKTADLTGLGGFDVGMQTSEEYELMFRMVKDGAHVVVDNEPHAVRRRRLGSLSRAAEGHHLRYVRLRREMLDYLEAQGIATRELRETACTNVLRVARRVARTDPKAAVELLDVMLPPGPVPPGSGCGTLPRWAAVFCHQAGDMHAARRRLWTAIWVEPRKASLYGWMAAALLGARPFSWSLRLRRIS
jgi:hypothetical protein